jgi:hypothetical protein
MRVTIDDRSSVPDLIDQVFFAAMMVAGAAAVAEFTTEPHLPGLAVWGIGVAWFVLGLRGILPPRRPVLALAASATVVGALNILPTAVTHWFPGDLAAPLVLLVVGGLLMTAAVYTATVRGKP